MHVIRETRDTIAVNCRSNKYSSLLNVCIWENSSRLMEFFFKAPTILFTRYFKMLIWDTVIFHLVMQYLWLNCGCLSSVSEIKILKDLKKCSLKIKVQKEEKTFAKIDQLPKAYSSPLSDLYVFVAFFFFRRIQSELYPTIVKYQKTTKNWT